MNTKAQSYNIHSVPVMCLTCAALMVSLVKLASTNTIHVILEY